MRGKIAVAAAIYAIDKPYTYGIPEGMKVETGMRVLVPFGRGNRRTEGVVLSLDDSLVPVPRLKYIEQVLDREPLLDEKGLRLAAFIRERYFCTFFDAVKAILPAGVWFSAVDTYGLTQKFLDAMATQSIGASPLSVATAIGEMGGKTDYSSLKKMFPEEERLQKDLEILLEKGIITGNVQMNRRVQDKMQTIVTLAVCQEEALDFARSKQKSAPLQTAALELLCTIGSGCSKEICYFTGCSTATLRRLEKLGFIAFSKAEAELEPMIYGRKGIEPVTLNSQQQTVYEKILTKSREDKPGTALLYGITGSGKTAVYLKLIYACLSQGKTAMLLVPEIALTPQLLELVGGHFGEKVAILHSGLGVVQRYNQWKRIRSAEATVVIGTRSAIFAPLENVGMIILDEEQENSYKSENTPRYHAREIALYRGIRERCLVLLGSATPSIESMYRAQKGDYTLLHLTQRYNGKALPQVEIVDMKEELKQGNASVLSKSLQEKIAVNIGQNHQTILFLNRRGTNRFLVCVDCGTVPQCPRCSVNLTFHGANNRLMCHYCGHSEPVVERCKVCSGHLKPMGSGTQKIEVQLQELFPDVSVLRMDADTVSAKNTHEKLFNQFMEEKIPIMVGTQMVAKGLNFENVTLVGVLDADTTLYMNQFRAAELTFSMITQVIGRSGRGALGGQALIQTMTPENAVIQLAAKQNYQQFYDMEIVMRKLRRCPPYYDLLTIVFSGITEQWVVTGAHFMGQMLQQMLALDQYAQEDLRILGPAPAGVLKVNNRFRYRLSISCKNNRNVRQLISHLMHEFIKDKRSKGISVFVDVNSNE